MKGKTSGETRKAKRLIATLLLALPFLVALAPEVLDRETSFARADQMRALLTFVIRHRLAVFAPAATLAVLTSNVVRGGLQSRQETLKETR